MTRPRSAFRAVAAALWLAACSGDPAPSGKPLVITSVYPIYELTRQIAGDAAEVVALVPPGVEPHDWEPAPQDLARIKRAAMFVYNGAGLEPWVDKLAGEIRASSVPLVRASDGIALVSAEPARVAGADPGQAPPDPHVWLDPVLAESMVVTIAAALERADPAHAASYRDNAAALAARLRALHQSYAKGLERCARREIVASHAAFTYLARRYGLTVVSIAGVAPEAEPTPAQLAAIVRFARDRKVQYIFSETLVGSRLAETLAREVGARTLTFNPIEGLTADERAAGKGYLTLMEQNLANLRLALNCA